MSNLNEVEVRRSTDRAAAISLIDWQLNLLKRFSLGTVPGDSFGGSVNNGWNDNIIPNIFCLEFFSEFYA